MKLLYKDSAHISDQEILIASSAIADYITHIQQVIKTSTYDAAEASVNLPSDNALLQDVKNLVKEKVNNKLKYIIDIGIGGSNLGTKAIYDALYGYIDVLQPERYPKIIFADTCNPVLLSALITSINNDIKDPDEVLINAISKSGGTTETVANTEIILSALVSKFPTIANRVVITTDEGSNLWKAAKEKGYACLSIPHLVGGRYSILSAVGLFPLAAAGVDIEALRKGALTARNENTQSEPLRNPALISAVLLYLHSKKGKTINDNFFFNAQMESMGKWYRQLMGESIGKEQDLKGNTVRAGITPTVSLGSTDLHSVAQLYLGGPKDKLTTFTWTLREPADPAVPDAMVFPNLVEKISGKTASSLLEAIREGVKIAYAKQQLPFMEIVLDEVNPENLGSYLQFKMLEMMYLGRLLNINTFDQPNVEMYKIETKKILSK
ncbi:MAG: Glucose-6-phosphate isomerase [Candidatus Parcubacteria bacterium]|jgi:glucose-6-phosphate isomerase